MFNCLENFYFNTEIYILFNVSIIFTALLLLLRCEFSVLEGNFFQFNVTLRFFWFLLYGVRLFGVWAELRLWTSIFVAILLNFWHFAWFLIGFRENLKTRSSLPSQILVKFKLNDHRKNFPKNVKNYAWKQANNKKII